VAWINVSGRGNQAQAVVHFPSSRSMYAPSSRSSSCTPSRVISSWAMAWPSASAAPAQNHFQFHEFPQPLHIVQVDASLTHQV